VKKTDQGINHDRNAKDAIIVEVGKKTKTVTKGYILPSDFHKLILPNLQEVTFKAEKTNLFGSEAYGVELTCKFYYPTPKVISPKKGKKKKSISDKLWLFVVKQSITAFFRFFFMSYQQFMPLALFLTFSMVAVVS